MKKSEVAIVILNWNGQKFLQEFLPSVIEHSEGARIIIADNASTDNSITFLREGFPSIEIIENESNGGFAKGYNDALKRVEAEFYVLLNSDVQVTEGWLDQLLIPMQNEEVAGCQPKVRAFHNKTHFEHAGASGGFIDKYYFPFCRGRILSSAEEDLGQYDDPTEVFWTTGACMVIRARLFHEVGGFDEDFFAHMEEIDLCWRLKRRGYSFLATPSSIVYHVGGGTLPYNSPRKTYLNFRNNLFMITKNHQGWLFPKIISRMSIDGIAAALFLVKGEFKQFGAVFKSHMSFYGKLGTFIAKRKTEKKVEVSANMKGYFNGSILWNYYVKGRKESAKLTPQKFK